MGKDKELIRKMKKRKKINKDDSTAKSETNEGSVNVPGKVWKAFEKEIEKLKNEQRITNTRLKTILHNQNKFGREISRLESSLGSCNNVPHTNSQLQPTLPGSAEDECVHGEVLRENMKMIVQEIRLSDSLLIDELLEQNCFTETDAQEINEMKTCNKTRQMILLLSSKDKSVFQTFIEIISKKEYYPKISKILNESYRNKLQNKGKRSECIPCFIVKNVDIMRIADDLCQSNVIDFETVQNIMRGDKPAFYCFWQQIFDKIANPSHGKMYMSNLKLALQENYNHIAKKIEHQSQLTCNCSSSILSYPSSCTDDMSEFSTTSTSVPQPSQYACKWVQNVHIHEKSENISQDDSSTSYSDVDEAINSKKHSNMTRRRKVVTLYNDEEEEDAEKKELVQHQSEELLSIKERISQLVRLVQAMREQIFPEVKVRQRSQPVDFSAFFSAVQGLSKKAEEEYEKDEGYTDTIRAGLHEKLHKIWGEDGVKVVQRSMEIATQATEKLDKREVPDQFCTVMCLDLSRSMAGNPIKQQRTEAKKILQSCLGQVAVVTIGDKTKVEQDLTQDKDTVKKILERVHIQPYGHMTSSPIIQGLLTALKLLQLRVKPTEIGHHHTVYPKVVIISDGLFNDCSPESEDTKQPCSKTDSLFASVLEVMAALHIHVPIYFLPVGEQLHISSTWVDMVTVVKDIDFLSDSMATATLTGRVMSAILEPKDLQTPAKSWQAIKKDLKKTQETKYINRVEWFITEHFKKPPPIGTRVKVSGKESQPTGTILQHIKGRKEEQDTTTLYVLVVLDTGDKVYHRWTFDQENLLFYKSSPESGYAALPVGTLVRRGRHWNYDNEDGGPDEIGVVIINKDGGRLVKVCWRSTSAAHELNVYKYGDQERFDIDVAESPLIDLEGLIDSGSPWWEVCDETANYWPLTWDSALRLQDSVALKMTILSMQEGHTRGTFRLEGDKLTDFNTNKTLWIRKMEET